MMSGQEPKKKSINDKQEQRSSSSSNSTHTQRTSPLLCPKIQQQVQGDTSPTGVASYQEQDEQQDTYVAAKMSSFFIPGITARARCLADLPDTTTTTTPRTEASLSSLSASTTSKLPVTLSMRKSKSYNDHHESTLLLEALQEGFDESMQLCDALKKKGRDTAATRADDQAMFAWEDSSDDDSDDNSSAAGAACSRSSHKHHHAADLPPLELWKKENWDELSSSRCSSENQQQLLYVRKMIEAQKHLATFRGVQQAEQSSSRSHKSTTSSNKTSSSRRRRKRPGHRRRESV